MLGASTPRERKWGEGRGQTWVRKGICRLRKKGGELCAASMYGWRKYKLPSGPVMEGWKGE